MPEDIGGIQASVSFDDSGLDPKLARLSALIRQLEAEMQLLQRRMQEGIGDTKAMADTLDALGSSAREMMVVGGYADDVQSKTTAAAEGMDSLGKATNRTAEEAARLDGLEREPQLAEGHRADGSGEVCRADKGPSAFVGPMTRGAQGHRNAGPVASLEDRLAHLTQVEQGEGSMLGGPAYEPSTKAVAGEDPQFRMLQDIGKTLEEIRKLYAATKTIGIKRRR